MRSPHSLLGNGIVAAFLVVLATGAAAPAALAQGGGPWPPEPGRFFVVWDTFRYETDRIADEDGVVRPFNWNGEFRSAGINLSSEYALTPRWTLEARTGYYFQEFEDDFGTLESNGFTDLIVGARYLVQRKPVLWTVGGGLSLPFLYDEPDTFTDDPLLGVGSVGGYVSTAVGSELLFLPRPIWWKASTGLTLFAESDVLNQAQYELTVGSWLFEFLAVSAQMYGTHSLESGPLGRTLPPRSFLTPNVQPGRTNGVASWQAILKVTELLAFRVGYFQEIYGRNSGAGDGLTFNVWVRR
jgi:hypothetical protein